MGISPRGFSLRQLVWMANEKRRSTGEIFAWHLCGVVALITGKPLNPQHLNPYRPHEVSEKMARVRAAMQQIEWRVMTRELRA